MHRCPKARISVRQAGKAMMLFYKPIAIPTLSQSPALIAGASLLWPPHRVRAAAFFKPLQRVRTAASAGGCGFYMHWPLPKPRAAPPESTPRLCGLPGRQPGDSLAQLVRARHDFTSLVLYESSRLVERTLACPGQCGSFRAEAASAATESEEYANTCRRAFSFVRCQ